MEVRDGESERKVRRSDTRVRGKECEWEGFSIGVSKGARIRPVFTDYQ